MKKIILVILFGCLAAWVVHTRIPKGAPSGEGLPMSPSGERVTLHLRNGSHIAGVLVAEGAQGIAIRWKEGLVTFSKSEVLSVERGKALPEKRGPLFAREAPETWPYRQEMVIELANGTVVDAPITRVEKNQVVVETVLEEGGVIQQAFARDNIESFRPRPVFNETAERIEKDLRERFPKMKWYRGGGFVIVTDSYTTWVKEYQRELREHFVDFYLRFFPLLKGRPFLTNNYIVIFDDWEAYADHALSDGVPGWLALGYFSPEEEVVYLPNYLGDKFLRLIEESYLVPVKDAINSLEEKIKQAVDSRYHIFIEDELRQLKGKFEEFHTAFRSLYREQTLTTLRHEATHELFHNWGLQTVVVSKVTPEDQEKLRLRKKEYLEATAPEKKKRLLEEIFTNRGETPLNIASSNSWFVEGLACYTQASPLGTPDQTILYLFQEARRKNRVLPLEQLTVYKMGSFPGISTESQGFAYAQSWAFVHFLMTHYPDGFMAYLGRMSRETPKGNEDIAWLAEALGKPLRELEGEFLIAMDAFETVDSPELRFFDLIQHIAHSF